ncbi:hypothetical protein EVAR_41861_1 [Eumeta japonica]|uniref:Uncharacterized protein n=1 Tax=Eumeta variegata TaxID=151549 RepID=A0A4C1XAQ5_EUMVA|nr:hypothetical protein EVAR_41861_1 [Eumeta japonica]
MENASCGQGDVNELQRDSGAGWHPTFARRPSVSTLARGPWAIFMWTRKFLFRSLKRGVSWDETSEHISINIGGCIYVLVFARGVLRAEIQRLLVSSPPDGHSRPHSVF